MEEFDRSEHVRPEATADARHEAFDSSADRRRRRWFIATGSFAFLALVAGALAFAVQSNRPSEETAAASIDIRRELADQDSEWFIQNVDQVSREAEDVTLLRAAPRSDVPSFFWPEPVVVTGNLGLVSDISLQPSEDPWFFGLGLLWLVPPILLIVASPHLPIEVPRRYRISRR